MRKIKIQIRFEKVKLSQHGHSGGNIDSEVKLCSSLFNLLNEKFLNKIEKEKREW